MDQKYRITFHDGPNGNRQKTVDIYAESLEDARKRAYQLPEARNRLYDNMMISQVPEGPSVIGIEFKYEMHRPPFHQEGKDYLFIRANSEAEALQYYNDHFWGRTYDRVAGKTDPAGHRVRGRALRTYYAPGMICCADATIGKAPSLETQIQSASSRAAAQNPSVDTPHR